MTSKNEKIVNAILKARNNFNDDISTDVFISKYALRDSNDDFKEFSIDDMTSRLSREMVRLENEDENWIGKLKKLFKKAENKQTFESYKELFNYFLFGGRTLYALGNTTDKSTFSNCYVIPIKEDSIEAIFDTGKEMAVTYRAGGGVGVDTTVLRAEGMKVSNSAKTTTGSYSFINLLSIITGIIGQNGRRGALMVTLSISHPDIEKFIKLKGGEDIEIAKHCNMSIKITNDFMEQLINNPESDWETSFTSKKETFVKKINIKYLWDLIIFSAWNRAEPGILFWDNILKGDPSNFVKKFEAQSTNPCSEIPLEPYGACNLGSINFTKIVENAFISPEINYEKFKQIIQLSIRALDLIIDENLKRQPIERQKDTMREGRRIGLGFTGYADLLSMMNLKYGSNEAIEFTDKLLGFFQEEVLKYEIELAKEKGAFPYFRKMSKKEKQDYISHEYFSVLSESKRNELKKYGVRNISFTTVAPTGTLSIIMGNISSGIEPIFQRSYNRKTIIDGKESVYTVYHENVKKWLYIFETSLQYQDKLLLKWYLNKENNDYQSDKNFKLMSEYDDVLTWIEKHLPQLISERKIDVFQSMKDDNIKNTEKFYEDFKIFWINYLFIQADEIDWETRINTQAIIQKHISHSISSTINLNANVEQSVVSDIYLQAYKKGLKGITVYRDGCRGNILSKIEEKPLIKIQPLESVKMKLVYPAKSITLYSREVDIYNEKQGFDYQEDKTPESHGKKWYVHFDIDETDGKPVAMFVDTNSSEIEKTLLVNQAIESLSILGAKYIPASVIENVILKSKNDSKIKKLARIFSMLLRHRVPIDEIISETERLNPPLNSFLFHVKHALAEFIDGEVSKEICPECGEKLYHENGCISCKNCGYSKCQ